MLFLYVGSLREDCLCFFHFDNNWYFSCSLTLRTIQESLKVANLYEDLVSLLFSKSEKGQGRWISNKYSDMPKNESLDYYMIWNLLFCNIGSGCHIYCGNYYPTIFQSKISGSIWTMTFSWVFNNFYQQKMLLEKIVWNRKLNRTYHFFILKIWIDMKYFIDTILYCTHFK